MKSSNRSEEDDAYSDDAYSYVWEFRLISGSESEFERIYGSQGD